MKNGGVQESGSLRDERGQTFHRPHKTGRTGGVPDGSAALQRGLGRLEKWANKYRIPCLGRSNPLTQDRLGAAGLESSSVGEILGILMDTELSMRQQCDQRQRRPWVSWTATRSKEVLLPPSSHW